jgi:glycosyltransferase involved in cell wall biosynthesis
MTRRTLFVDDTSEIGGAEVNLVTIAQHLKQSGWDPSVIVPHDGPLCSTLTEAQIPLSDVPGFSFLSSSFYLRYCYKVPNPLALVINAFRGSRWIMRLLEYFRRSEPAIIHTMSMWSHIFAGVAGRLAGFPVVWHFQDIVSPSSGFGMYKRFLVSWARWVPSRIICISQKVADQFEKPPAVRAKVRIVPNTIDTGKFTPAGEQESFKNDGHSFTIGTVARLTPWKGHEVALQAARILKRQPVQFQWLFAGAETLGSPGYRAYLLGLVCQWGLEENVRFVGWVEDMPSFYRSLDVLVHVPTEPEPFGLVPAEAMASGLPVLATSGGGTESMIEAGGGILIPPGQAESLADALMMLWKSPAEMTKRGHVARRFAERTFGIEGYIEQLIEIYRGL